MTRSNRCEPHFPDRMKRILFISHEASRTGAPMVVVHFIRWLRAHHPSVTVDVLSLKGGPLDAEFREVAHRYLVVPPVRSTDKGLVRRGVDFLVRRSPFHRGGPNPALDRAVRALGEGHYDLIVANSLRSIPVGRAIKRQAKGRPRLVAHIHELDMAIRTVLPDLAQHLVDVDRVFAVSNMVKECLVRNWGVRADMVDVQYEFSDHAPGPGPARPAVAAAPFVIGASGAVNRRKGYDLFIQVAQRVVSKVPADRVRFTWVGSVPEYDGALIEHDLRKTGLAGIVEFIGEVKQPQGHFRAFDVFVLPSREDPFPLVCIEMGLLAKPIICFADATGSAEVLVKGGGRVVPYLDVEAMAQAVLEYMADASLRHRDGEAARSLFSAYVPAVQCPLMFERLEAVLRRTGPQ